MSEALPFHLLGNFGPVSDEVTASDLPVEGEIPRELRGLYVRNGANPVTGRSAHWFLGHGMLHGVRIEDGRAAWYRNRYVRTPYLDQPEMQRISPDGQFDRTASAANTHVIRHAGRILALEEASFPYQVSDELDTLGCLDFDGRLEGPMTAHPKLCPVTGEMLFFGYAQLPPYLVYHRVSPDGKLVQSEPIDVGGPTMMHDFAITEHHALFMDLPVVFDLELAMQGTMPFRWSDGYPARVGIMPRQGTNADVRWFDVAPCYVFHGLNAFERDGAVVFDVCRISEIWRDSSALDQGAGEQTLHRFTFDLESGRTSEQTLDDRGMDFPRVADERVGLEHRFGYTLEFGSGGVGSGASLLKFDFASGRSERHAPGAGLTPGEAVFVPAPGSDPAADEGWVLTFTHDEDRDATELWILDAQRFSGAPRARIALPQRVPYGFHGSFLPDAQETHAQPT